jgi:biopolymer transport protein ExbD
VLNFDEEPRRRVHIEIIPMIDVMMFLLVFFVMISLNVIPLSGLKTHLPQSANPERMEPVRHLVITLAEDGHIEAEGRTCTLAELPAVLRAQAAAHPKLDVIVNGDRNARIEELVKVMDITRANGIYQVAIAAKKATP